MQNNEKNQEILDAMNQFAAASPESEYKDSVKAEQEEDPDALMKARKKVLLMLNMKCKGIPQDIIIGQIKPMVEQMNIADCENMAQMIKKKGMYGLPIALNKKVKHG